MREECPGYGGCSKLPVGIDCDRGEPTIGEPCGDETVPACSLDKTHLLTCRQNKWQPGVSCRGPEKCSDRDGCDRTRAMEGDLCDREQESRVTCALDLGAILRCEGGRFVLAGRCPSGKRCDGIKGAAAYFGLRTALMEHAECK